MQLLNYKKVIGFTDSQKKAFETLESYGVNVNHFIRIAIKEKLARDWKQIKQPKVISKCPF